MASLEWLTARPVAHRGYHDRSAGRIENTLSAAEAAIARRFPIECDLQLTADGEVVIFHDDTLDRVTDSTGPIAARTLAQLKATRLHDTDDRIPTLAEFLDLIRGQVPLVIELKRVQGEDGRLEVAAAKLLADYAGPMALMSFNPLAVRAVRGLLPSIPRGLLAKRYAAAENPTMSRVTRFALQNLLTVPLVGAQFVAYHVEALPTVAPLMLRRLGLPLLTWTVSTAAHRETAARFADQIIFEGFDPDHRRGDDREQATGVA